MFNKNSLLFLLPKFPIQFSSVREWIVYDWLIERMIISPFPINFIAIIAQSLTKFNYLQTKHKHTDTNSFKRHTLHITFFKLDTSWLKSAHFFLATILLSIQLLYKMTFYRNTLSYIIALMEWLISNFNRFHLVFNKWIIKWTIDLIIIELETGFGFFSP